MSELIRGKSFTDFISQLHDHNTELARLRNELSLTDARTFVVEIAKLDDARQAIQDTCNLLDNSDHAEG